MIRVGKKYGIIVIGVFMLGCLDPYSPPTSKQNSNFLVIDGFINTTENVATVKLSRALDLTESSLYPRESNAAVFIEDQNNQLTVLPEISAGVYSISQSFNYALQYRLRITAENNEYISDYIDLEKTPLIDSLNWKINDEALDISVSSHDLEDRSIYYQYSFVETYEYTSVYSSSYKFENGIPIYRLPEEEINKCWTSTNSTSILLNSTENLGQNVVSEFPIIRIRMGDRRLWNRYSILVKQKSLSKKAYSFWSQLKKTNESLGSLFDPIPYQIKGNVHSITNPEEPVLGYFTGGEMREKRIVIRNNQLPFGFGGAPEGNCSEEYVPVNNVSSLTGKSIILTTALYSGIVILGYYYSIPACVDCRIYGGTNVKPDFMN